MRDLLLLDQDCSSFRHSAFLLHHTCSSSPTYTNCSLSRSNLHDVTHRIQQPSTLVRQHASTQNSACCFHLCSSHLSASAMPLDNIGNSRSYRCESDGSPCYYTPDCVEYQIPDDCGDFEQQSQCRDHGQRSRNPSSPEPAARLGQHSVWSLF